MQPIALRSTLQNRFYYPHFTAAEQRHRAARTITVKKCPLIPDIWNQFVWVFCSWVFFLSIWHCYSTFFIQIIAQVDFCHSCKNSTSLYIWPQMNCTGHPENMKLILKAQMKLKICPVLQGRQHETAAGMESSFLNRGMRLLLLLPHCLRHMPSSIGKNGVRFCTEKSFIDCTVLTHSRALSAQYTEQSTILVKDGENFLVWNILRTVLLSRWVKLPITAIECSLLHVCIP